MFLVIRLINSPSVNVDEKINDILCPQKRHNKSAIFSDILSVIIHIKENSMFYFIGIL